MRGSLMLLAKAFTTLFCFLPNLATLLYVNTEELIGKGHQREPSRSRMQARLRRQKLLLRGAASSRSAAAESRLRVLNGRPLGDLLDLK